MVRMMVDTPVRVPVWTRSDVDTVHRSTFLISSFDEKERPPRRCEWSGARLADHHRTAAISTVPAMSVPVDCTSDGTEALLSE
jgi:hypothetical protein